MNENFNKQAKKDSFKIELLDFVRMVLVCFVVVFLFTKFGFQSVTVDGNSMNPTLKNNESGFSNVITTFFTDVKRFEIVVVNDDQTRNKPWVKRVIGLPNETLEFRGGVLYINEKEVKQDFFDDKYVLEQTNNGAYPFTDDYGPITLKENQYFLMGDNRRVSKDSRIVGPFPKESIVSKDVYIIKF